MDIQVSLLRTLWKKESHKSDTPNSGHFCLLGNATILVRERFRKNKLTELFF